MEGTEKQIKWAKDIQGKLVGNIDIAIKKFEAKLEKKEKPQLRRQIEKLEKAKAHIDNVTHAALLIKLKDFTPADLTYFVYDTQVDFENRIWELG